MMRVNFLLYDSRSGSTFLSKNLHQECVSLVVTPEISLFYALRAMKRGERRTDQLRAALKVGRYFESLGISADDFSFEGEVTDAKFGEWIRRTLADFARRNWPDRDCADVVVKKGHHAFVADQVVKVFPDARFICLYRDPRSVLESKGRTPRPYRSGENMGWAGTSLTTYRWCQYADSMFEIERRYASARVCFEDLSEDRDSTIERLIHFLGLERTDTPMDDYAINAAERGIHTRSVAPMQRRARPAEGLSALEVSVVELVARGRMQELGYQRASDGGALAWLCAAGSALAGGLAMLRRSASHERASADE